MNEEHLATEIMETAARLNGLVREAIRIDLEVNVTSALGMPCRFENVQDYRRVPYLTVSVCKRLGTRSGQ